MRLRRITPAGRAELFRRLVEGTDLRTAAGAEQDHWSEPRPADIGIDRLADRIASWSDDPRRDADHAVEMHEVARLPRRVAGDRAIWPWLAGLRFAGYTQARWSGAERGFNTQRIGGNYLVNALGRLWWTAEQTRVDNPREVCSALDLEPSDDPYCFTRRLLQHAGVHQELTYRDELSDRTKLIAFLTFVEREGLVSADVREAAKALNLLFSTTIVAGFETTGAEAGRHHVDPAGCRKLMDYMRSRLLADGDPWQPRAGGKQSRWARLLPWRRT